ncbi:MAG: YitT family protein [Bacilli bacterium]
MKKTFYSEIAYILGVILMALGTAFMVKADFGVSMVVAPAFVIYKKINMYFAWFTFGMAEYLFQAVLLIILILVIRKFKVIYLFSFLTAILYGLCLDGWTLLVNLIEMNHIAVRIVFYIVGFLLTALSVAFLYNTYICPVVYELFVKETSKRYKLNLYRFKTMFDISFLLIAIILSFSFFGWMKLVGVGVGTICVALLNGTVIGLFSKMLNHFFVFSDAFKFRKFFEKSES